MKKLTARLLLLTVLLSLLLVSGVSTTSADTIGSCGMPYIKKGFCLDFGFSRWCLVEDQACADCDGGTFCYPIQ
jgi:hypothetical protein